MIKKPCGCIPAKVIPLIIVLGGCATVPQETVEMSRIIGEDIAKIKKSHMVLVNDYFDNLTQKRMDYLEKQWLPAFIERSIVQGKLREIAAGKLVISEKGFIPPKQGEGEQGLLTSTVLWSMAVAKGIEEKKKRLVAPLEVERKKLLRDIEDDFDRLMEGNAAITAHLNSIRKANKFQNEALKTLKPDNLKEGLEKRLDDISKAADKGLEEIQKVDGFLKKVDELRGAIHKPN